MNSFYEFLEAVVISAAASFMLIGIRQTFYPYVAALKRIVRTWKAEKP